MSHMYFIVNRIIHVVEDDVRQVFSVFISFVINYLGTSFSGLMHPKAVIFPLAGKYGTLWGGKNFDESVLLMIQSY